MHHACFIDTLLVPAATPLRHLGHEADQLWTRAANSVLMSSDEQLVPNMNMAGLKLSSMQLVLEVLFKKRRWHQDFCPGQS